MAARVREKLRKSGNGQVDGGGEGIGMSLEEIIA
jgi:hypothetical protein